MRSARLLFAKHVNVGRLVTNQHESLHTFSLPSTSMWGVWSLINMRLAVLLFAKHVIVGRLDTNAHEVGSPFVCQARQCGALVTNQYEVGSPFVCQARHCRAFRH